MRIAVVTPWFPSQVNPVLGIFVEKEARALKEAGHDVRIIFLDRAAAELKRENRNGLPVLTLPVDVRNPVDLVAHSALLRRAVSFADVVHSQAISSLPMLGLVRPRNWVHTEHWSALTQPDTLPPHFRWLINPVASLLGLPTIAVGVTEQLNDKIRAARGDRPVRLIPCVVPSPPALSEAPGGKQLKLVSVGGVVDRKDPLLAVKTLKVLQDEGVDASLRWVGQGPLMQEACDLATELGVDAQFIGAASPEEVQQELLAADMFFGPTKGDNFFVSAAESLVCGRPVCVGVSGGHVDYIPPQFGEVVSEQTPQAYAQAIIRLRQKTAGVSARQIADSVKDQFSPQAVARMLEKIYRQAQAQKITVATRIHLPEPGAAPLRWDVIEKALASAGYEVEVLTSQYAAGIPGNANSSGSDSPGSDSPGPASPELVSPVGVMVKRWPVLRDKDGNLRGYVPYMSFDLPLFFRLLLTRRPDLVMVEPPPTTGVVARAACALRGIPYIWYAADTWTSGAKSMGAPAPVVAAVEWMEKTAIRGAKAVIAVTGGVAGTVKDMGALAVVRVPNGIDIDVYQIDAGSDGTGSTNTDPGWPRFAYTGTASEFQGALIFLDAFEQLLETNPQTQLYFMGSGSDWEKIRRRADHINASFDDGVPRVVVEGSKPPSQVAQLLNSSTAALVSIAPAHGGDTPYPTKVLAALATGTPVVYVGPGEAARDINANNLGWAVDYDLPAVVGAMREVLVTKDSGAPAWQPQRLRQWVIDHRSTQMMGDLVVDAVDQVLEQPLDMLG